jgi:phenylacetate-CoA ligase
MEYTYWNKEAETCGRDCLEDLQLRLLQSSIDSALKIQFYKKQLKHAGVSSSRDIKSLSDLQNLPFTSKDDLRASYPEGLLSVPMDDVVRLHTSSGTTGIPSVIYHTSADIDNWSELVARCVVATGAGKGDVFQNMTGYGLFTGGLGLHYGAERAGLTVIPTGSGHTARQIKMMQDFRTTVVHATPSYMLHLYDNLVQSNIPIETLSIKKAFLGAEPYSESTRQKIETLLGIDVYNSYGLSEMNGPGVSFECVHKNGMHTWEDSFFLEIINPETGEVLPDGEAGEVVFTTLRRQATPLIRYRTRDLSTVLPGTCPCGRVHRRIERIKGRTDDMLIVNGVNIFPSQVEAVLMNIPEVGTNYLIRLTKKGALDRLTVMVEIYSKMFSGDIEDLEALKKRIAGELHASIILHPHVELHEPGSLPVTHGKAQRVLDERPRE